MVDDDRAPTLAEYRWFRRLRRVLRDMPETVELTVRSSGNVCLNNRGATERCFLRDGRADQTPDIAFFSAANVRGEESSI